MQELQRREGALRAWEATLRQEQEKQKTQQNQAPRMPPNSPPAPSGSGAGVRRTENLDSDDDGDDGSGEANFDLAGWGGARGSAEETPPPLDMADDEDFGCVQGFLGSLSPFSARKHSLAFHT